MRAGMLATTVVAVACAAWPLSAQTAPPDSSVASVGAELLAPGDMVRITVWRKPEISGEYQINADGVIANPFYMDVQITGLPLDSVKERIRVHVARFENDPRVLVESLFRIAISGEVRQPDLYNLPPTTTVEQAVLKAGGLTERARANRVMLVRGDRQIEVDLTRHADGLARTTIRSADQIVVPRRVSFMREYVAPASSVVAAAFSIVSVWLRVK